MNVRDLVVGLDFDDDLVFHKEIDPVPNADVLALVLGRNRDLTPIGNPSDTELPSQCFVVDRLQQSGTQFTMDFDSSPNDLPSDR